MDRGRTTNIVHRDGFVYKTRRTVNNVRYLVCKSNRTLGCKATVKVTEVVDTMGNQQFIRRFTESQVTLMDGTFQVVPRRPSFGQILTIFATAMDHAFPLVHVFMERRTKALYDVVFSSYSQPRKQISGGACDS